MNSLAAVACAIFCVLHGIESVKNEHAVKGMSADKQPSLGHRRKMSAVTVADFSPVVSGLEVENRGTCTMTDRLEPGWARSGSEIDSINSRSPSACAEFCATRITGCVAINYFEGDTYNCVFLSSVDYLYRDEKCTTALIKPTEDNVCWPRNLIVGYVRAGNNMPGSPFDLPSAVDCCKLCYRTRKCIAYGYNFGSQHCYLKNAVARLSKRIDTQSGLVCLN